MSDATLLLRVEAKKKSGWLAAFLNLILPGAGYIYCGRWVLGIIVFLIVLGLAIASGGLIAIPLIVILIADGFLAAGRYNKKLINSVLAEEELKSKTSQSQTSQA